jgi:hypothetical protein
LRFWSKSGHLKRIRESGRFRYAKEIVVHYEEAGNAQRLVGLLLSQGSVAGLLREGYTEAELGIEALRETAVRLLGDAPTRWYWSARIRAGVV